MSPFETFDTSCISEKKNHWRIKYPWKFHFVYVSTEHTVVSCLEHVTDQRTLGVVDMNSTVVPGLIYSPVVQADNQNFHQMLNVCRVHPL